MLVTLKEGSKKAYYHIYKNDQRVGYLRVSDRNTVDLKINLQHRSKGYATDALRQAAQKHPNLEAHISKSNKASIRAATKAGFKVVDDRKQLVMRHEKPAQLGPRSN